ncbi:MAG: hypothetical protein R2750_01980 [Bacteroidales bacterium]
MRPLTSSELLTEWEQGLNQPLLHKTFALLQTASPELNTADIAKLSIGNRDARLFKLREWMFGSRFRNMAECPECSERVEWETRMTELNLLLKENSKTANEFNLEKDGYNIQFRLPNSDDIISVVSNNTKNQDPTRLLNLCVLKSKFKNRKVKFENLPENILQDLTSRIEELDPMADIRMKISCPNCSHEWESRFDIISYLWAEIDNWAKRMLQDIFSLARAFGWSEKEILEMNPMRRNIYVEMVRA